MVPSDAGAAAVAAMLALAGRYDLRQRSEESCRESLQSVAEDGELGSLRPADIQVVFERCALVFDHAIVGHPFIETRYGLYVPDSAGVYSRGLRPIGHYRLITRLEGTDEDDYLVLEEPEQTEPDAAPRLPGD
jgi:hypothetical protein